RQSRSDRYIQYSRHANGWRAVRNQAAYARRSVETRGVWPMRKSNFALRLQSSLLDEARKVAESEGVALNQFINVAVAEKLSALRTESYFLERRQRADIAGALKVLERAGKGNPPEADDRIE